MTERQGGREEAVEVVVGEMINESLLEIAKNYESGSVDKRLVYHNTLHTVAVIARTELILRTMAVEDPKLVDGGVLQLGRLAAAYHDLVQEWREVSGKRVRESGISEAMSIGRVLKRMQEGGVFNQNDEETVAEAIMATIPECDPERRLIYQPYLGDGVGVVAVAVALADINACGLEGAQVFLRESDLVFVEENMDIAEAMVGGGEIDEGWKQRIVAAAEFSVDFAKGRRLLIDSEVALLLRQVQGAVRELFWGFDESIVAAEAQLERRKEMSLADLLLELGRVSTL